MKPDQTQLLKALGAGVRPFDIAQGPAPVLGDGFSTLLDGALRGKPQTQLGIRFAPAVSGVYGIEEQRTIASGVDRAAASGIDQALILHDQHTLRVDVRNRVVLEAHPIDDKDPVTGIDGFVSVSDTIPDALVQEETEESPPQLGTIDAPARVVRNASLVHALAGRAAPA